MFFGMLRMTIIICLVPNEVIIAWRTNAETKRAITRRLKPNNTQKITMLNDNYESIEFVIVPPTVCPSPSHSLIWASGPKRRSKSMHEATQSTHKSSTTVMSCRISFWISIWKMNQSYRVWTLDMGSYTSSEHKNHRNQIESEKFVTQHIVPKRL